MKKLTNLNTLLLSILLIFNSVFIYGQTNENCDRYKKYDIKESRDKNNNIIIDVFDIILNKKIDSLIVNNCACNKYHFAEYYYPNLYVIKEFNQSSPNRYNELWVVSKDSSKRINRVKEISFSVNEKQDLLAYIKDKYNVLNVKNLQTRQEKSIKIFEDTSGETSIDVLKWSTNKNIVWGSIGSPDTESNGFFSYNFDNGILKQYRCPKSLGSEFDLNPDLGLLLYSDYVFPLDAAEGNEKPNIKKTLYIYNLYNKTEQTIVTINSKSDFIKPSWICSDYYEYQSSQNKTIKLKYK